MASNKKKFISILSLLVAAPAFGAPTNTKTTVTTTTSTSGSGFTGKQSNKASITLPFSKTTGYEILGGTIALSVTAVVIKLIMLYRAAGGPKTIQQLLNDMDQSMQASLTAQETANKTLQGKSYKPMDQETKDAFIEKSYYDYILGQTGSTLGIDSAQFTGYIKGLPGADISAKLDAFEVITNALTVNPNTVFPNSSATDFPYKGAVRYAVANNIQDSVKAVTLAKDLPVSTNVSNEPGAQLGRVAGDLVNTGTDALNAAGSGIARAGQAASNAAQEAARQAGYARDAYNQQVRPGNSPRDVAPSSPRVNQAQAAQEVQQEVKPNDSVAPEEFVPDVF